LCDAPKSSTNKYLYTIPIELKIISLNKSQITEFSQKILHII